MFLNKVIIIGNLTRDPELRAIPSGAQITNFSVATNRVWKDKDGNKQESAEFHNITVYGRQAEAVAQYLKKGQSVLIEGRIQTRSWEDKETGKKMYRAEIIAERVQFGPKKDGAVSNFNSGSKPQNKGQENKPRTNDEGIEYPEEEINPEDIPF
ncbi:MAG: single-stranded DNA-binding protein [Candidatus Pacebacteria bacterium]|nr:single-stranded DNA-binding protein [Candidatus Paceibacterota bacterium]